MLNLIRLILIMPIILSVQLSAMQNLAEAEQNIKFLKSICSTELKGNEEYQKLSFLNSRQKVPYLAVLVAEIKPESVSIMLTNKDLVKGIEASSYPMAIRDMLFASNNIDDVNLVFSDSKIYPASHDGLKRKIIEQIQANMRK